MKQDSKRTDHQPESSMVKGKDYIGISCAAFCHDGNGNFVMHKRSKRARDEQGKWDICGGSLEFGEDFETAIRRELKEEYGCEPIELQFVETGNAFREHNGEKTHWVWFLFAAKVDPKQIKNNEPEKIDEIGWFEEGHLPSPLHSQFQKAFSKIKKAGIL